ncbi:MAG: hypothetical protein V3R52_00225 [Candidatus Neomarinimicrobiota bacterium]
MKIRTNEDGFIVSVTSLIVAVILGLFIIYFSNSISLGSRTSSNDYTNSQANWAAISGIEYAMLKMTNSQNNFADTYSFSDGTITIDTTTIDPVAGLFQVTSTGTYGNSIRIYEINFLQLPSDTLLSEGFDDDEGFEYEPSGAGPGNGRFWGMTCGDPDAPGFFPEYVLTGADSCYFFGGKIQANSDLEMNEIPTDIDGNYILTVSLSAGVDVFDPASQSLFQTGDYFELYVNDSLIERWEGISGGGGNPMIPLMGNSIQNLTPAFEDFTFNVTSIIGAIAEMEIGFQASTNTADKYIGIEGLSLYGSGGFAAVPGSHKKR